MAPRQSVDPKGRCLFTATLTTPPPLPPTTSRSRRSPPNPTNLLSSTDSQPFPDHDVPKRRRLLPSLPNSSHIIVLTARVIRGEPPLTVASGAQIWATNWFYIRKRIPKPSLSPIWPISAIE